MNVDPKKCPSSRSDQTSQLQRLQEETPCQIGYSSSVKAKLKNDQRFNQREETPRKTQNQKFLLLRKDTVQSPRVNIIGTPIFPEIPILKFAR